MERDLFFKESCDTANLVCDKGVDKNIGIYMLSWNGKPYYYYGGSINLKQRKKSHFGSLKRGKHENFILLRLYSKYGLPNFTVLEYCDKSQVDIIEQRYLDYTKGDKNNVNICPTVTGAGRIVKQETRDKMSKSASNRVISNETRARMSESQKGEKNHRYGKPLPQARKDEMSKKNKGGNSSSAKRVIDLTNGKVYDCAKDVLQDFSIKYSTLAAKLNGRRKKNETPYRYLDEMIFKN